MVRSPPQEFLLVGGLMGGDPLLDVTRVEGAIGQGKTKVNEVAIRGLQMDAAQVEKYQHRLDTNAFVAVIERVVRDQTEGESRSLGLDREPVNFSV